MKAAYVTSQSLVQALIIRVHFKYNNPSLLPAAVSITRLEVEKSLTQEKIIMVSSTPALGYIGVPTSYFLSLSFSHQRTFVLEVMGRHCG